MRWVNVEDGEMEPVFWLPSEAAAERVAVAPEGAQLFGLEMWMNGETGQVEAFFAGWERGRVGAGAGWELAVMDGEQERPYGIGEIVLAGSVLVMALGVGALVGWLMRVTL